VSAHFRNPAEIVPEEPSTTVQDAMPIGYGISKWIAEQWTYQASLLGLKTRTFIVGYIAGSSATGSWNQTDSIPRILEASREQNLVPEEFGEVNWIPVNVCASVITCVSMNGRTGVFHVVNPATFQWQVIVDSLR
jgi:thioester reductase-like protein